MGLAQYAALVAALLVPIELAERPVGAGIAAATRLPLRVKGGARQRVSALTDPKLATAGIHFARVLERPGIQTEVAQRLQTFRSRAGFAENDPCPTHSRVQR